MAGIQATHVPSQGSGPALPDLVSGRTQSMIDIIVSALKMAQSGKRGRLAAATAERCASLPELPTLAESGLPGYEAAPWYGCFAPTGTPAAIVREIESDIAPLGENRALRASLARRGPETTCHNPPPFSEIVRDDLAERVQFVTQTGVRAERGRMRRRPGPRSRTSTSNGVRGRLPPIDRRSGVSPVRVDSRPASERQ